MRSIFSGTMPALMTPCKKDRTPDFESLLRKAEELISFGMSGVVYCGSMGDWPLLTDEQRMYGVECLVNAGIPVVVGTGAINSKSATALARHAQMVGAAGLMVIPRVLSRGSSAIAQENHFRSILSAAPDLPAIIYNSPVYGFSTRAELFFSLQSEFPNLVGFKEFGGRNDLRYAAENITSFNKKISLVVGVDTEVFHGFVNCGATGVITGIGNALPNEILLLVALAEKAAAGQVQARLLAQELESALSVLSSFDEGPDLVLYYKHLLVLNGEDEYRLHFNASDELTNEQRAYCEKQYSQFKAWFHDWRKQEGIISSGM